MKTMLLPDEILFPLMYGSDQQPVSYTHLDVYKRQVSAISPRIPANCLICWLEPRAPESAIMKMLLYLSSPVRSAVAVSYTHLDVYKRQHLRY